MKTIPSKLEKALNLMDEAEKQIQIDRYHRFHNKALEYKFQSPEFWASRMILSGRSDQQIDRVIAKRLRKANSSK